MLRRAAKLTVLALLRSYRYCISPFLPPSCRFFPSCSEYATQAIERFGVIKGVCLASSRICRCHPFHRGGHDPVPDMDDRA